jgi:excisionase family DNA binding protein
MDFSVLPDGPASDETMLSLSDAVRYLGTFRPHMYRLISSRQLPAYRMLGRPRAIYVKKRDLDAIRPRPALQTG